MVGGIGSYYNSQGIYNQYRLQQALMKNTRYQSAIQPVQPANKVSNSSLSSSVDYLKEYNSTMADLMSAGNSLRSSNRSSVMSDLEVTSSDSKVALATEKFQVRSPKELELEVTQLAQAQQNVSTGVAASQTAAADMNFSITQNVGGTSSISVSAANEDGSMKTNRQMLSEAADQINSLGLNVQASVEEKDGVASLRIAGKDTGSGSGFQVSGELGAAAGLNQVESAAQDAKYTVKDGDNVRFYTWANNQVSLDLGRIGVDLKSTGKTTISAAPNSDKIASAVEDLVDNYNDTLKLLNDNADRGSGTVRQLRNMVMGLGSEKSLESVGIHTNKDGTLKLDKEALKTSLKKNPDLTRDILGGAYGIGEKAFSKGSSAITANAASLINYDLSEQRAESVSDPFNFMNAYSRSGAYSSNNYYALGMMMNYLV